MIHTKLTTKDMLDMYRSDSLPDMFTDFYYFAGL